MKSYGLIFVEVVLYWEYMRLKEERNKELVLKRLEDPKRWTFDALADHYGIGKRAVWEVFQRDWKRYKKLLRAKR